MQRPWGQTRSPSCQEKPPIDLDRITGVTARSGIGVDVTFDETYIQSQGDV
jgi:hypothetical protein